MKKLCVVLMIMVLSGGVFAQTHQNDTLSLTINTGLVTDGDFEKLFDKYSAKTADGINEFLSRVKAEFTDEAEFVWKAYVRRYKIDFIASVGFLGFSLILFAVGAAFGGAHHKNTEAVYPESGYGVVSVIFIIIGGLMFIGSIISAACQANKFFASEYHALQDLLSILK